MASVRPVALVVEDLHWADAATLDLVEHLVVSGSSGPPLVGTYRVEDPATPASVAEWRLRLQRNASVTALDVGALSRDETARQIQLLTGTAAQPELTDRIHARSRGHPLFTEQLVSSEGGDLPRLLADLLDQRIGELDGARMVRGHGARGPRSPHRGGHGRGGGRPAERGARGRPAPAAWPAAR